MVKNKNINMNMLTKKRKCIVNADLDGLLSGLILNKFLKWDIVGFSSCSGRNTDEVWLLDKNIVIEDCVFIDLPVIDEKIDVIDQHFILYDIQSSSNLLSRENLLNPNLMEKKLMTPKNNFQYFEKYPFGTVHFLIAILENLGIINPTFDLDILKSIDNFQLVDLILRADGAVMNMNNYNPNCTKWSDWLIDLGGRITNKLFVLLKNEYSTNYRKLNVENVGQKLMSLGCSTNDGDCSNLLRERKYFELNNYLTFLSKSLGIGEFPVITDLYTGPNLTGRRYNMTQHTSDEIKNVISSSNVFSYAFTGLNLLSITFKN